MMFRFHSESRYMQSNLPNKGIGTGIINFKSKPQIYGTKWTLISLGDLYDISRSISAKALSYNAGFVWFVLFVIGFNFKFYFRSQKYSTSPRTI